MSNKLKNKVAVITGGTSGIGLATAKAFAAQGAQVVLLARSREKLNKAIAEIGHQCAGYIGDVTDLNSLKSLYQNGANDFGKVDILFACAGVFASALLEDTDEALFDHVTDVNFKGIFFTVKYALPCLNEGASVILVASIGYDMGIEGASVYSAGKAAVRSLARSFTPELAKRKARVNVLSPGSVETPIFTHQGFSETESAGIWQNFATRTPAARVGQPSEMASIAVFLASDDSSYLYGSEIQADGGLNQVRWQN